MLGVRAAPAALALTALAGLAIGIAKPPLELAAAAEEEEEEDDGEASGALGAKPREEAGGEAEGELPPSSSSDSLTARSLVGGTGLRIKGPRGPGAAAALLLLLLLPLQSTSNISEMNTSNSSLTSA